jgi:hypothetical protein
MGSSEETEITLGTGKLLFLFFGLVGLCALFFAIGYSLGRKSEPTIVAAGSASPQVAPNTNKAGSGSPAVPAMTFYKSVEQKEANPELTNTSSKSFRLDYDPADVGIFRASRGGHQTGRRRGPGGCAQEERLSRLRGAAIERQVLSRTGRAFFR